MQTEWSTPDGDAADAPAASAHDTAPHGASGPPGDGAVGARATGAVGAEDEPLGEEELHRSAVDTVDGLLDEVERALTRLDDGTYGRCEACGEPIDDERLAALPIVRSCGRCDRAGGTPADRDPLASAPA